MWCCHAAFNICYLAPSSALLGHQALENFFVYEALNLTNQKAKKLEELQSTFKDINDLKGNAKKKPAEANKARPPTSKKVRVGECLGYCSSF